MAGYADGGSGQERRLRAVMIEVACPRHGRVMAEVTARTSAAGPPCPACGSGCTIYAPMLALACACADAAPRLGVERLLQVLRHDASSYTGTARTGVAPSAVDGTLLGEPVSSTPPAATAPRD